MKKTRADFATELASGSAAGLCVDIVLFPLDTVKTRLQSAQGFIKAGGFAGIYRGIGSTAVGSVPGAAIFFGTYETVKSWTHHSTSSNYRPLHYMLAASCGETMACIVRVPTEVVKQRAMTSQSQMSSFNVLMKTLQTEGFFGLYRGYLSTVFREIPFSLIQFPIWETLKTSWSDRQGLPVQPWQSSVCGALSGGFAAAVTTPLDVAKTRIMLAEVGSDAARGNVWSTMLAVRKQNGLTGLFAGVVPRVLWISLGGAIFLGVYDKVRLIITTSRDRNS